MSNKIKNLNQNSRQNKNQKRSSKKEPFSLMTVKTLLAILLFTGMGVIIIGGGYIILENCKISDNSPIFFEKQVVLATDKTEYQTGEEVKLTVRNNLDKEIEFYAVAVEKFNNNNWEEIRFDIECLGICEKMETVINSKNNKSFLWDQKDNVGLQIDEGKFRFKIEIYNDGILVVPPPSIYYSNEVIIKSDSAEVDIFGYCENDNDCYDEAFLSGCDCQYYCLNKNDKIAGCAKICDEEIENSEVPKCTCWNNKCIDIKSVALTEESEHFIIYSYDKSLDMEQIKNLSENAYSVITKDMDTVPSFDGNKKIKIYIYQNQNEYSEATKRPHYSIGCIKTEKPEEQYTKLEIHHMNFRFGDGIPHELTHIIFRDMFWPKDEKNIGHRGIPKWIEEGFAVYEGQKFDNTYAKNILMPKIELFKQGKYTAIREMPTMLSNKSLSGVREWYAQSWSIVSYLLEEHEKATFFQLCSYLGEYPSIDFALDKTYPDVFKDTDELTEKWALFIKDN